MYGPDDGSICPVPLKYFLIKRETLKSAATFACAGCTLHKPQGTSHTDKDSIRLQTVQINVIAALLTHAQHCICDLPVPPPRHWLQNRTKWVYVLRWYSANSFVCSVDGVTLLERLDRLYFGTYLEGPEPGVHIESNCLNRTVTWPSK